MSEERYRLIAENANDLITILNAKFKMEYFNQPIHQRILGYGDEDLMGMDLMAIVHPADLTRLLEEGKRNWKRQEGEVEARFKRKDGNYIWLGLKGNFFMDKNGNKMVLMISRDLTERKKTELQLRESEKKYRLISENANDLIAVINLNDKTFEYINEATFQILLGYSQGDLIGKTPSTILHPADRKKTVNQTKEEAAVGEGLLEARIKKKDGTYIWLENKGRSFIGADGQRKALIIARDITDRKKTEEKLRDAFEQIRRQNIELKELDQSREEFYADVSHELRTPLISIRGYTELLLHSANLDPTHQQDLRTILRNAQRLEHFVNEILDFTALKTGKIRLKMDSFRISEIIAEIQADFQFQIHQKRLKVEADFGHNPKLLLDRLKITRVVQNFFTNAVKFSRVDGKILLTSSVAGDHWTFSIRDWGIGILKTDLPKLFTRFTKLNPSNQMNLDGVGLGLAICKKIIDLYDGKIRADSEGLNTGACFTFRINLNLEKNLVE